jgi:hypothetical protein
VSTPTTYQKPDDRPHELRRSHPLIPLYPSDPRRRCRRLPPEHAQPQRRHHRPPDRLNQDQRRQPGGGCGNGARERKANALANNAAEGADAGRKIQVEIDKNGLKKTQKSIKKRKNRLKKTQKSIERTQKSIEKTQKKRKNRQTNLVAMLLSPSPIQLLAKKKKN